MNTNVLAILGYFPFMLSTAPFQKLSRETSWRHPTQSIIGALPKTQFLGKENDSITISGRLAPEITGGTLSLSALRIMADQGGAYPLIEGSLFSFFGFFVIESLSEDRSEFFQDGTPRLIDFTLKLKRTDDANLIETGINLLTGMI